MGDETKYPNIEALAAGTIAGAFRDWPKLRPEAKAVLADCARKDAALRPFADLFSGDGPYILAGDDVKVQHMIRVGDIRAARAALAEAAPAAGEMSETEQARGVARALCRSLEKALSFAQHRGGCSSYNPYQTGTPEPECDCGLVEFLMIQPSPPAAPEPERKPPTIDAFLRSCVDDCVNARHAAEAVASTRLDGETMCCDEPAEPQREEE